MKPFLGLFVNWDVVTRQEPPEFLGRFFRQKTDSEQCISKELHSKISSTISSPKRIIGGNAGNAAVTLSELGIPCILSCPSRPESLMQELSKHKIFLVDKGKEKTPKACTRPEKEPAHIIFEMAGYRKIFTFDEVQLNFLLDYDFWNSLKNASYLFLSGFHTVPEKHKRKVREIADFLEKRKFKTHLELGFGKGLMKYGIKRLVDRNCIDSMGMNETEIKILGISNTNPLIIKEKLVSLLEKTGLERMSLHTREYRLSVFKKPERNLKGAEFSIQACAAKALGGIKENMEKAKKLPRSGVTPSQGKNFILISTLLVEKPKLIVGLGDTAAVTDSFYALKR